MRVSRVSTLHRKLAKQRKLRFKRSLLPPYDCPFCEGFDTVQVTKDDPALIFHCLDCDQREVIPFSDGIVMIDYYNMVADKWLSMRFDHEFEEPAFAVEIDLNKKKDRDGEMKLKAVTLGKLELSYIARRPRKGKPQIPWDEIIGKIIETDNFYTVAEIIELHEGLSANRVKTAFNKAFRDGKLERRWYGTEYIYGKPIDTL